MTDLNKISFPLTASNFYEWLCNNYNISASLQHLFVGGLALEWSNNRSIPFPFSLLVTVLLPCIPLPPQYTALNLLDLVFSQDHKLDTISFPRADFSLLQAGRLTILWGCVSFLSFWSTYLCNNAGFALTASEGVFYITSTPDGNTTCCCATMLDLTTNVSCIQESLEWKGRKVLVWVLLMTELSSF